MLVRTAAGAEPRVAADDGVDVDVGTVGLTQPPGTHRLETFEERAQVVDAPAVAHPHSADEVGAGPAWRHGLTHPTPARAVPPLRVVPLVVRHAVGRPIVGDIARQIGKERVGLVYGARSA